MNFYNKKGNAIVYNVLIVLISVAFVAILGVLVLDIVKKTSLSPEFSCYDMKLKDHLTISKACYNISTNNLEISIRRDNAEVDFDSLDFSLLINGAVSNWKCGESCSTCEVLNEGQFKKYLIDISDFNFSISGTNIVSLNYYGCEMSNKQIIGC